MKIAHSPGSEQILPNYSICLQQILQLKQSSRKNFTSFRKSNRSAECFTQDDHFPKGWSLIYRKLKSLIITYSNSNRSTCDYGEQRNSGDRGTVGTEERKAQRNTGHRALRGWSLIYRKLKSLIITYSNSNRSTCDYGEQRNSGDRGTVGTEERKAQRNTGHRGTVGAEEQ